MLETARIPDWLVDGLVEAESDDGKKEKQGGPSKLWQKVDADGSPVIMRSARKTSSIPIRRVI